MAAHYTPNPGDDTVHNDFIFIDIYSNFEVHSNQVLQYGDVMKVDFGTQIDGKSIP